MIQKVVPTPKLPPETEEEKALRFWKVKDDVGLFLLGVFLDSMHRLDGQEIQARDAKVTIRKLYELQCKVPFQFLPDSFSPPAIKVKGG